MVECIVINCMDGYMQIPIVSYSKKHYGILNTYFLTIPKPSFLAPENHDSMLAKELLQHLSVLRLEYRLKTIALVTRDEKGNETKHAKLATLKKAVQTLAELHQGIRVVGLWMDSQGAIQEVTRSAVLKRTINSGRSILMSSHCTVSIVMGSKSDNEIMLQVAQILKEFGIDHEIRVMSAHRTPTKVYEFCQGIRERGVKVIIAGAGKAAHLAGVIASLTTLPVIGVPMKTSDLGGLDSLLSTVQMPGGIPVATTAIGNAGAKNAGLLAVAMLALSDQSLVVKLEEYRETIRLDVEEADCDLQESMYA
jgi:5-(carboxyamino)imidazole ribonucleotide mutase